MITDGVIALERGVFTVKPQAVVILRVEYIFTYSCDAATRI